MNSQDNYENEARVPMRFRILIYALGRGITRTTFMQAYNEILSNIEETEYELSPEMRQSMVECQVWTKFFPDETSPPPLEFPIAEGYFDPPLSRKAVEQYRIWQLGYLDSHRNQKNDSEPQFSKMQQSESNRPVPDIGSVDPQLRYSSNDVIRGGVEGYQLGRNMQSQRYAFQSSALQNLQQLVNTSITIDTKPSFAKSISPVIQHDSKTTENLCPNPPQRARTYEGVMMHNSEVTPTGGPAMDDLTITPGVDNDRASMPNQ
ncbi:hypothetical protein EAE96_002756 [Botrytis aclada]|nr:hypothetical protein EAE96_002756 [Botrytis aclada]